MGGKSNRKGEIRMDVLVISGIIIIGILWVCWKAGGVEAKKNLYLSEQYDKEHSKNKR